MSSAGDSQAHIQYIRKTDNYRLHDRFLHSAYCLTLEHAKVLLPQIIPKAIAKKGSKIRLLLLFFGANDASLKGTQQHVLYHSLHIISGPVRNIRVKSSRTSQIPPPYRTQSRHQTPANHTPTNLCIPLWRSRS